MEDAPPLQSWFCYRQHVWREWWLQTINGVTAAAEPISFDQWRQQDDACTTSDPNTK
jgi:hypothetical protein